MKKIFTVCFLLFAANCLGQAPNWQWATSAVGTDHDYGRGVSTDAVGNVYMTGSFQSSITFGTTVLTCAGNNNVFVVKYDTSGNVLWAKSAGSINDDYGWSVSTNAIGNTYVTGFFYSSSIAFGTIILTNSGFGDIFVAKLDSMITTGIIENRNSSDAINISPNPTSGIFTIIFPYMINKGFIEIYNTLGEKMLEENIFSTSQKEIHLQNISSGIYFLKVRGEEKEYAEKFVVK